MIEAILDEVLRREGGYVDHPADRGGPTKFGITAKTLGEWRRLGRAATANEVSELTPDEARAIYRQRYVVDPGFEAVTDETLLALLVDAGVHSGPKRAVEWLQTALGVTADGILGPRTRAALAQADPVALYRRVLATRLRFLGRLITKDQRQAAFAAGWMARLAEWVEVAP
jgi:lysozyme family protein